MTTEDAAGDFQRSTRMPLDAVVRLHFEGTVAFQNGFAANVSASGMFVKHPDPPPVGTRLVFEFGIGSQRRPVQGGGVVVWSREKYEGPGRPAGAGIRFVDLDELSRQHLAEALFEFLEASLGDRVAEHPEVAELVSQVPTHAPADLELPEEPEPPAPEESATELLPSISEASPEPPSGDYTPFRIFDEEPAPPSPADLGTMRVEIPTESTAIPPEPETAPPPPPAPARIALEPYSPVEPIAGVAVAQGARGSRWPLLAALIVVVLGAAGAAGWWFFLRQQPGLAATSTSTEATAEAPQSGAPEAEAPPPLDPTPGPETTLAESVGATRPAPKTEVPPAPPPGVAAGVTVTAKAPAEEGPGAGANRLTRVNGITASSIAGGTTVVLAGDGGFHEGSFSWSEIGGDKPRVLIRLKQIEQPYRGGAVASLPTSEVANVRTGYHQNPGGNELHVVLDLVPSARVTVESVEPSGDRLVVRLVRR